MPKLPDSKGYRTPCQTMTIGIPIDVKKQVDKIVERFCSGDSELFKTDGSNNNRRLQLTTIVERYKAAARSSKD